MPPSACKTSHKIASIQRREDGSLDLSFTNGTTASVDAVIGGDGVHSTVRKHVLEDHPDEVNPFFSGQYFYVTMAPIAEAKAKMGECFPNRAIQYAWCGDQAFLMHDPANSGQTLQVLAAVRTNEKWESDQWTKEKSLAQMREDLQPFGELGKVAGDVSRHRVERLSHIELTLCNPQLFAEQGDPLQVRSVWEHPRASTYNRGHAAILGDAAHAMQPW